MELKKVICKSGNEYNIVNEYWETSRAWGHKSTLLKNGYEVDTNKVKYLNRTWECYTYQSCMSSLLSNILYNNFERYVIDYKRQHGIERLKKGQKEKIKEEWEKQVYIQDLMEIKERINGNYFKGD